MHALPPHSLGQGLIFLAAGAALFLLCLAVQYLAYSRLLLKSLRSSEAAEQRRGLKRWASFVVAWQALLILALAVYALQVGRSHPRDLSWIAPPIETPNRGASASTGGGRRGW